MNLTELSAISPIDGRYRDKTAELAQYFSEYGLIRYRVLAELEYLIELLYFPLPQLQPFDPKVPDLLYEIFKKFSMEDASRIKEIEKITNHDVKAVEYFLREKFEQSDDLRFLKEFIHFGLTSQDINNTAIPMTFKAAMVKFYFPILEELFGILHAYAKEWEDVPMLARTHGQPASPTRLGKELFVFIERMEKQDLLMRNIPFSAKFGGATGNFNAHHVAFPEVDWIKFADQLVNSRMGLDRSRTTTQIEHYDNFAAHCDALKRINNILIDLNRDIWTYISMNYFKQQIKEGEVGSSAMPHKVNPIDFENSEGNLGIANALFDHMASKLPISRLQRDLTDSTVLRNIGVPFAHTMIAIKSTIKGLKKLLLNRDAINADLESNWAVVAEGIQTVLRREGYPNPYEVLKKLTRTNSVINAESMTEFINGLDVSDTLKDELKQITPWNYTGIKFKHKYYI